MLSKPRSGLNLVVVVAHYGQKCVDADHLSFGRARLWGGRNGHGTPNKLELTETFDEEIIYGCT